MKSCVFGMMISCVMMFSANIVKGEENMISEGKIVKFDYVLRVDNQVVDSSEGKTPMEYTHGQKTIIPGLESKLEGLKVGDKKTVIVGPEDAYGVIDQKAIIEVPTAQLGEDINPQVGMKLQMTGASGQPIPGKVVEVKETTVIVDFNHPLAGKELQFEVEIVEVQ